MRFGCSSRGRAAKQRDYKAVAETIARIRSRWKEAASPDLLDAQLALDQGDTSAAATHFDEALKKDPTNKLIQFWKAQLESQAGAVAEAAKTFEAIAKDRPTKELDSGVTLLAAARWCSPTSRSGTASSTPRFGGLRPAQAERLRRPEPARPVAVGQRLFVQRGMDRRQREIARSLNDTNEHADNDGASGPPTSTGSMMKKTPPGLSSTTCSNSTPLTPARSSPVRR